MSADWVATDKMSLTSDEGETSGSAPNNEQTAAHILISLSQDVRHEGAPSVSSNNAAYTQDELSAALGLVELGSRATVHTPFAFHPLAFSNRQYTYGNMQAPPWFGHVTRQCSLSGRHDLTTTQCSREAAEMRRLLTSSFSQPPQPMHMDQSMVGRFNPMGYVNRARELQQSRYAMGPRHAAESDSLPPGVSREDLDDQDFDQFQNSRQTAPKKIGKSSAALRKRTRHVSNSDNEQDLKTSQAPRKKQKTFVRTAERMNRQLRGDSNYRAGMIHALRRRLLDYALPGSIYLETVLIDNDWSLDDAESDLLRDLSKSTRIQSPSLQGVMTIDRQATDAAFLFGAGWSIPESHRRATDLVYRYLSRSGLRPTAAVVTEALRSADWMVDTAVEQACALLTHGTMRPEFELSERRLRIDTRTQYNRDRRIARFLQISGTNDLASVTALLENHNYDYSQAVEFWLKNGLPYVEPQPIATETMSRRERLRARYHDGTQSWWDSDRPLSGPVTNITNDDLQDAMMDYPRTTRAGWPIRFTGRQAMPGIEDPSQFIIEGIRKATGRSTRAKAGQHDLNLPGELKAYEFGGVNEAGTGRKGKDNRQIQATQVPFDWDNSSHVSQLNKFRRQTFRRLEDDSFKQRIPVRYVPKELTWLEGQIRDQVNEVNRRRDSARARGHPQPSTRYTRIDLKSLTERFNKEFANRTDVEGSIGRPRPSRNTTGIKGLISHQESWCNEFGFKYSRPHPMKPEPGSVQPIASKTAATISESKEDEKPASPDESDNSNDEGTDSDPDDESDEETNDE